MVDNTNKIKQFTIVTVAAVIVAAVLSGCGLSDKEKAKYYQATDLINAASNDFGDTYDSLVEAYFNTAIDYDKNIEVLENAYNNGLLSEKLLNACKEYQDYTDSMVESYHVDYTTNGNPKTNTGTDMSSVFSMVEQLERGWIGSWMYAIPEGEMNNVLNAFYDNHLVLDFENGDYAIVDYQTDVYGNIGAENDTSRKLDTSIPDYAYDLSDDEYLATDDEYADFLIRLFDLWYYDLCHGKYVSIRHLDNWLCIMQGYKPESCDMVGQCSLQFVVEGNGSVYPCDFYVLDEYCIGTIDENDFFEMSQNKIAKQFIEASLYVPEHCRACQWYTLCRNGCRRDRLSLSNERPGLNRYCKAYKKFFAQRYTHMLDAITLLKRA